MAVTGESKTVVGVDVSKDRLDVDSLPSTGVVQFTNDPEGHASLIAWLKPLQPRLIVLEASGGYERQVVAALAATGLPVVIVNPRQVRDFARAIGILAKTDAIDAKVLARFGEAVNPEIRPIPNEQAVALAALLARRRQLLELHNAESNRLAQANVRKVEASIRPVLVTIEKQLDKVDRELTELIKSCPCWQEKLNLLKSVPGIGDTTAFMLLGCVPELGTISRQTLATLVGVAPMNRDSGCKRGKRTIIGGRKVVRSALYMPVLVAIRHNPIIRDHYKRLLAAGKPKKLAIVACMRKLLTILNAMIRTNQPWKSAHAAP
jgi:transposase